MTREEAIEFGKMWLELQEDCKDSNTYEFFKMAIEALQQEPTYTSKVAQKAYEDGKKDGYIQRKIETIADNLTSSKIKKAIENLPKVKPQEPCEDAVSWWNYDKDGYTISTLESYMGTIKEAYYKAIERYKGESSEQG